jgi:hypothetical protein
MTLGTVRAPTKDDLRQVAADLGMSFSDEGLAQHLAALMPSIAAFNIIDKMPDEKPRVTYPRVVGYRPSGEENTHAAWSRWPRITFRALRARGSGVVALRSLQPRRPHRSRLSLLAVRTDYADWTGVAGGTLRPGGASVTRIAFRSRRARGSCVASGTSKSFRSSGSGIPLRSKWPYWSDGSSFVNEARRSGDPRRPCSSSLPSIALLSLCARGQRQRRQESQNSDRNANSSAPLATNRTQRRSILLHHFLGRRPHWWRRGRDGVHPKR